MNIRAGHLFIRALLVTNFLTVAATTKAQEGALQINYSLLYDSVTLSEPVVMNITLHNQGDGPLRPDLGLDKIGALYLSVSDANGTRVVHPPAPPSVVAGGKVSLGPGDTYQYQVMVSQWTAFDAVGTYAIMLHIQGDLGLDGMARVNIQNTPVTLTVISVDDLSQLRDHCTAAAKQLEDAIDYRQAMQAANYLAHVNNPAAVPFISEGLLSKYKVAGMLVSGLERIGDASAVDALVQAMHAQNSETATVAKSALLRLQKATQDPGIQSAISQALHENAK